MSVQNATEPAGSDGPSGGWGLKRDLPRLGWTIAIAATLCLVVGHAWPHDLARTGKIYVALSWASFVVMTLRYHAGLLLVLVAVGAGVGRRWKLAGFASLVGLWAVWPTWALLVPRPPQATAGSTFRVMSVNLLCVNRQTGALAREIETADAHVLLLQEYTSQWHETLATRLAVRYPHRDARPRQDSFGAAIYSKLPFAETPRLVMPIKELPQVRAVVTWSGRRVAIYNLHLLPPHSFSYLPARRRQIVDLLRRLGDEPLPVVVAGDFNFTSNSPGAFALEGLGLADAHRVAGWGHGHTWPVHGIFRYLPLPGFRIDHIYLGAGLTAVSCRTGRGVGSDHRPLICEVGLSP